MQRTLPWLAALLLCTSLLACSTEIIPTPEIPTETSEPDPKIPHPLPHALYYLAPDTSGVDQVWRIDPQLQYRVKITFEPAGILDFDVSPKTGRLAYIADSQLITTNPDGSDRQVLASSNVNETLGFINAPLWRSDGLVLAYAKNGIHLIDPALNKPLDDLPNPQVAGQPNTNYTPSAWSPDGQSLLITVDDFKQVGFAVYSPANKKILALTSPNGKPACCTASWSPDSRSILVANPYHPTYPAGLWRFDAASGQGATLINSLGSDGTYNLVNSPVLTVDGMLFYFYSNLPAKPDTVKPLMLVSSQADGVTGRALLRPDSPYYSTEVLWASDASLAVTVQILPGGPAEKPVGPLVVLFTDGQPNITIAPQGFRLRWGA